MIEHYAFQEAKYVHSRFVCKCFQLIKKPKNGELKKFLKSTINKIFHVTLKELDLAVYRLHFPAYSVRVYIDKVKVKSKKS